MTENGLAMDSNGTPQPSSNGISLGPGPSPSPHASENGGFAGAWQKVVNPKKQKRLDSRSKPAGSAADNGKRAPESKVFQSLEKQAEERRAHMLLAASNAHATTGNTQSDSDVEGDEDHPQDANENSNGELKKPKLKKPKKPKVTVAEAASAIDPSDLAAFLNEISVSFSDLTDVQLMRFADYFGKAFNAVSPTQFGWNKILKESSVVKTVEIPLCYVPESVNKTASDWLASKPVDTLGKFILWALNDVLNDIQPQQGAQKGLKVGSNPVAAKTKVAALVVAALALRKRPEALLQKADVLRTSPQFQGSEKLAMLAWAYGQAAQGDLVVGMQLWVQNLLPLACGKTSTPASRDIVLQFAESILFADSKKVRSVLQNSALRKGERMVPPLALESLMHASFPTDASRTKATERFLAIYPLLKELALAGAQRSKITKPVAQQLLPLSLDAASEDVPVLAHEACEVFIWCLSQNTDCFKQWEKLHLEKLKGSVQVLSYICSEWSDVIRLQVPLDELRNTVDVLRGKNHTARENVTGNVMMHTMLKTADKYCKVLNKRLARTGICFKLTAMLTAVIALACALYMINPDVLLVR